MGQSRPGFIRLFSARPAHFIPYNGVCRARVVQQFHLVASPLLGLNPGKPPTNLPRRSCSSENVNSNTN